MLRALTPFGRLVVAVLALSVAVTAFLFLRDDALEDPAGALTAEDRNFETNDPVQRACALPERELLRLWRGHHDIHSEDVTIVPLPPNYSGSFGTTSHSGPWDYVQTVPLVLYGPGNIGRTGRVEGPATVADIYPTAGALTGVDLPRRAGRRLAAALEPDATPKLIVTVVWDGVGRNVLERWDGRWPNLARLEEKGASFVDATVGSSPSITPATHATIGTGAFPRDHGVTAIEMRREDGSMRTSFSGKDPSDLDLTTFADEIDLALDNEPRVGMLAWKSWHMGMLGHGSQTPGGDADEMAIIAKPLTTNAGQYSLPDAIAGLPGPERRAEELDRQDGEQDGKWRGHTILDDHDSPAWVEWETDVMLEMLERGRYGSDDVPDLFFTNYKPTDIVGHRHGITSDEMGDVLEAQDRALGRLVEWLDEEVEDYVVVVTSDHGNTLPAAESGGWPVLQGQLQLDVDDRFEIPSGRSLITQTTAAGPFLDREVMQEHGVSARQIARFLNGYTIADNWAEEELPAGYEDRGEEPVLAAAFVSDKIDRVMRCAFGRTSPPPELEG